MYAHDRSANEKHQAARKLVEELWESGDGAIGTQVLQELCVSLRRKAKHPLAAQELRRLIQDYFAWEIVVNARESALEALEMETRYQVSFWDALILSAAESCGASVLYSEDFSAGQRYGSVTVVNPLAASR